jgi:hypothetical protein
MGETHVMIVDLSLMGDETRAWFLKKRQAIINRQDWSIHIGVLCSICCHFWVSHLVLCPMLGIWISIFAIYVVLCLILWIWGIFMRNGQEIEENGWKNKGAQIQRARRGWGRGGRRRTSDKLAPESYPRRIEMDTKWKL